ncbi:formate/nitrite transporter family protein [Methylobacterium platani]|uniref:Transporter (Formate/nitrite transporter family protein) n=2 Tax=Methylobacterium platani TaxID=427683 RepID=A0A179S3U0_9HYPH|nr:formate/nitrite transporter family protein [Methylobacterium platani]KMO18314.1 transporter (formate/nitrite transporter family protein) [Methylobacterium platani JCM 14648]OAS20848.1 transporter (formate/nitrite transporter family protein) [Methylobacterium platani]
MANRDEAERGEIEDRSAPRAAIVHEAVRRQGEEELSRPAGSLFWSSVAAGIAIMASVIAVGALHRKLPEGMAARTLVSQLGYPLGFLIVILGRLQLFTEQTIVTVLPLATRPSGRALARTARLWGIVLLGNLIGTAAAAGLTVHGHLVAPGLLDAMLAVSRESLMHKEPSEFLLQGIPAGFLIATVAWLRAASSGGEFWIVFTLTFAIVLGDFTHVVAGAAEAFLLLWAGEAGPGQVLGGMILPALAGNVIGGTGLFALLAHAQVRQEL